MQIQAANVAGRNKIQDATQADIDYPDFSNFILKVDCAFMEKKVVIDEEELDGIEIYGILNLENLPRTAFIG